MLRCWQLWHCSPLHLKLRESVKSSYHRLNTAKDIASLISCAACDHEYPRVIVYPIEGVLRQQVLEILKDPIMYPMYEYKKANIVSDDNLDSRTIIYKYAYIHSNKPI